MPSTATGHAALVVTVACLLAVAVAPAVASPAGSTANVPAGNAPRATTCAPDAPSSVAAPDDDRLPVETLVAPRGSYDRLTNASAIAAARRAGRLTNATAGVDRTPEERVVAIRDVVVHRVALDGSGSDLLDRLTGEDRDSPTAEFRALSAGGELELRYWGPTACPPELALNASVDAGAFRVVPDRENGSLYLVLDIDRLRFYPPGGDGPTTEPVMRGTHRFSLTVATTNDSTGTRTASGEYGVVGGSVSLAGRHDGLVRVAPGANRTVAGQTTRAPGSELRLTLRPVDGATRVRSATVTVNESRGFLSGFDLGNASGAVFRVEATDAAGEPVLVPGTLVAVGDAAAAVVDLSNQTTDGTILYGPSVTTTHGGFVTVRNESGRFLAVSDYVPPGRAAVQIDLATPLRGNDTVTVTVYRDVNGNRAFDDADVPYRSNGTVVSDSAAVTHEPVDGATPASTEATTTATPASPSPYPTTVPRTTERPPVVTTTERTPGFGVVVAAAALALAGVVARRRGQV